MVSIINSTSCSCLNPVIYGFMSRNFRKSFTDVLFSCHCCHFEKDKTLVFCNPNIQMPKVMFQINTKKRSSEMVPILVTDFIELNKRTFSNVSGAFSSQRRSACVRIPSLQHVHCTVIRIQALCFLTPFTLVRKQYKIGALGQVKNNHHEKQVRVILLEARSFHNHHIVIK